MGKAIPNTEVMVVRPDGSLCEAEEHGDALCETRGEAVGIAGGEEKPALEIEELRQSYPVQRGGEAGRHLFGEGDLLLLLHGRRGM